MEYSGGEWAQFVVLMAMWASLWAIGGAIVGLGIGAGGQRTPGPAADEPLRAKRRTRRQQPARRNPQNPDTSRDLSRSRRGGEVYRAEPTPAPAGCD